MKKINHLDIIVSPNITEKSTSMSDFNKVVFKVDKKAYKPGYKKAVITLKKGQSIDLATGI